MFCNFDAWPQNYLTTPEAFRRNMLHSFRALFSFSEKFAQGPTSSCRRDSFSPYFWHLQCLWNCRLWLAVFTVFRSGKDSRCGFEISWKHRRLSFDFSLLVRLIWFCEIAKLNKSVSFKFQNNDLIRRIFVPKYEGKPQAQECIFQQSTSFNIKKSSLGPNYDRTSGSYRVFILHSPYPNF